ncbi:ATP-binding protein [Streptomyces sp. T-3]|nr:ATP-binding protein [Streptomyces sp. T-3]
MMNVSRLPRHPPEQTLVICRWTGCAPEAPANARAELRRVLGLLGLNGEAVSDAVLAVSELVANATEHAPGPYELRLRRTAGECICEVEDGDPRLPVVPAFPATAPFTPDPEARGGGLDALVDLLSERGRGLHIVDELTAGAWGFRCTRTSKIAWVALPMPRSLRRRPCDRRRFGQS